jgi:aspartyl-tRNA(Asn)/glutamyl-tRNA(Gln) amidotransferase subunit C
MGKLSRDDILKLARLSRLQLSEAEIMEFQEEISEILQYVELLQSVDVTGLMPTNQVTGLTNVMRADTVINYGYAARDLLKNVPVTQGEEIKVDRMIG